MAVTYWREGASVPRRETLRKIVRLSKGAVDVTSLVLGVRK